MPTDTRKITGDRGEEEAARFLARSGGEAAKPTGRLVADVNPEQNFGASLL